LSTTLLLQNSLPLAVGALPSDPHRPSLFIIHLSRKRQKQGQK